MADIIQIRVVDGTENSHFITLPSNAKIDHLFQVVAKEFTPGLKAEDIRLLFADETLEYNTEKTLEDYHMVSRSTVVLVSRARGGILTLEEIEAKTRDLEPFPGFITVTTSPGEPDMISLDNSSTKKRAKMPCGHVIGPESMTSYCQSLLSEGRYKFYCPAMDSVEKDKPACNKEWEYFLVRHVACLTPEEMHEFEKKISSNYMKKSSGYQQCPGCNKWCFRSPEIKSNRIRCPMCTKSNGTGFEFCWACLNEWKGSNSSGPCGNGNCDGKDKRFQILATCPTKVINNCKKCPSIRGCPKCGILTEHIKDCGHVTCKYCNCSFCFICMKKGNGGTFPCLSSGDCVLAPRQTDSSGNSYTPCQTDSSGRWCTIM